MGKPRPAEAHFLDPGDVDQALQTASAIGDDRLQKETQGYVVPDLHPRHLGAAQALVYAGFQQGEVSACNTCRRARFSVVFRSFPQPAVVRSELWPRRRDERMIRLCKV